MKFRFIGGPWDSACVDWPDADVAKTINGRWIGVQLHDAAKNPAVRKLAEAKGGFSIMHTNDEDGTYDFDEEKRRVAADSIADAVGDAEAERIIGKMDEMRTAVYTLSKNDGAMATWLFRETTKGLPQPSRIARLLE